MQRQNVGITVINRVIMTRKKNNKQVWRAQMMGELVVALRWFMV